MPSKNNDQTIDPSVFASGDDAATGDTIKLPAGGFVVNFAEIPDANEPVAPGTYDCTIVAAEPTTSKAGNPMIKIRWRIDDEGPAHHRNIFDNLVFTPAALWRVRQVLEALGFASNFAGNVNPESLIGEAATLKITIQAGNGNNPETGEPYPPRNNVAKVSKIGTSRKVADLL